MNETIDFAGETFALGCNVPEHYPTALPSITTAPGFRVWSKSEIIEAIKAKPLARRKQFAGEQWIVNQRNLGSCNAAASVGALRRVMAMTGRNEVPLLCWEFLYAQINGGRDQGSLLVDGMAALVEHGAPPLDTAKHPIGKHFKASQFDAADHEAAKAWRAEACFAIDDELELATFILAGGAANVAVHVGNNFTQLNSQGFAGASGGPGNHAVVVDDVTIIDGELAFDMPNSWGLNFGDDGRAYLSWRHHFRNTVGKHRFFSVAAASNPGGIGVVQ